MKRPNFFIIGAPKCGTTSLASWLGTHPQIYFSPRKEPHFFNIDGVRSTTDLETYEKFFEEANDSHLAVGEGSTHYLYSDVAVSRILDYEPNAKFIVCLRNPLEMAPALHAERIWQGEEFIQPFEKAWRMQEMRAKGFKIPRTVREEPKRLQYGECCMLGKQLQKLYQYVPKSRVLVVILDDMRLNPRGEYLRILDFLNIEDDGKDGFSAKNPRKTTKSPYLNMFVRNVANYKKKLGVLPSFGILRFIRSRSGGIGKKVVSEKLNDEMRLYFKDDVAQLSILMGRDLSKWLDK